MSFIKGRSRPQPGRVLALEPGQSLDHHTPLKVRKDCLYQVFEDGDSLRLALDGKSVTLPAGVKPALAYMASTPAFTAAQLPDLEHDSRLLLAAKLHAEGWLARCAA
jgi:hypothetical protein